MILITMTRTDDTDEDDNTDNNNNNDDDDDDKAINNAEDEYDEGYQKRPRCLMHEDDTMTIPKGFTVQKQLRLFTRMYSRAVEVRRMS